MSQVERPDVLHALRDRGGDSLSGLSEALAADPDDVFSILRKLEYDNLVQFSGFHYGDTDGGVQPSGKIELTDAGREAADSSRDR